MKMLYAVTRNNEIVAKFPTKTLAEEAYEDLGCWIDDPKSDDVFEVLRLSEVYDGIYILDSLARKSHIRLR